MERQYNLNGAVLMGVQEHKFLEVRSHQSENVADQAEDLIKKIYGIFSFVYRGSVLKQASHNKPW